MTHITQSVLDLLDKYQVSLKQYQLADIINKIDGAVNHLVRSSYDEGYNDGKIGGGHTEEACGCGQPSCKYCN